MSKAKKFFNTKFEDSTKLKLALWEDYLKVWISIWKNKKSKNYNRLNIVDLFSGPGKDSDGVLGSPLIALKYLPHKVCEDFHNDGIEVHCYFNDINGKFISQLKSFINPIRPKKLGVHYESSNYEEILPRVINTLSDSNSRNLVFLDPFGIAKIEHFNDLLKIRKTDVLLFVPSDFIRRFQNEESIQSKFKGVLLPGNTLPKLFHRDLRNTIQDQLGLDFYICSFTIKRGNNYHGLIYGCKHPLGAKKFIETCWRNDNYNGGQIPELRPNEKRSLFQSNETIELFLALFDELETSILTKKITNTTDLQLFCIRNGLQYSFVDEVINKLFAAGKIEKFKFLKSRDYWQRGFDNSLIILKHG